MLIMADFRKITRMYLRKKPAISFAIRQNGGTAHGKLHRYVLAYLIMCYPIDGFTGVEAVELLVTCHAYEGCV